MLRQRLKKLEAAQPKCPDCGQKLPVGYKEKVYVPLSDRKLKPSVASTTIFILCPLPATVRGTTRTWIARPDAFIADR